MFSMTKRYALAISIICCVSGCADELPHLDDGVDMVSGKHPIYPIAMADQNIQGRVLYQCNIDINGYTHDCVIISTTNHGFDEAVLAYAAAVRFRAKAPNTLPLLHHTLHMDFTIAARS